MPSPHLLRADNWSPPVVEGPPSAANFCALLTAVYRHEQQLPDAASSAVKEAIVRDYVSTVPAIEAEAPAPIAAAARTYLGGVARVLAALDSAGLDYRKVPAGTLGPVLLDPAVKSAGNEVLAYSENTCHYNIATP